MRAYLTRLWAGHRRKGISALGALFVAAGLGTVSVGAQTSSQADDPLVMFAELMPVLSSPRCVNCHGGTNPATNLNHPGGRQDVRDDGQGNMSFETGANEECLTCHTAAPSSFRLAPKRMSFVGKDTLPLCRQFRTEQFSVSVRTPEQRAAWLEHVTNDDLIGMAFVGQGGVGEDSAFWNDITTEPPPMSRQQFVAAARHWLIDGEGACSNKWNGTITETTMVEDHVTFAPAAGGRAVDSETKITITVVENVATAQVHYVSRDFTDVPTRECATYVHHTYTVDGSNSPVQLTIALKVATIPAGASPQLPPGFEFPPGFELPPGMTLPPEMTLPPGTTLPPGLTPPPAPGDAFFMYASTDTSEVPGTIRIDARTLPGCVQTVADSRQPYHIAGGLIDVTAPKDFLLPYGDPDNPNHLVGEKTIEGPGKSKTVIKWDLIRDVE